MKEPKFLNKYKIDINNQFKELLSLDKSEFSSRLDPSHPAANEDGYVKIPNVKTLVEVMDMREAQRSYEANLTAIRSARSMLTRTIDLLRSN